MNNASMSITCGYRPNDNLQSDGTNTYTYDEQNRLIQMQNSSHTATYEYDAFNRRVSKTVDGTTTYFVYDGSEVIEEYNSSNVLQADYVMGRGIDEVLTMDRSSTTYYYHYDGLNSVRNITNSSGTVLETYDYNPYGQITTSLSSIGNPYYFTGRRYDDESGVYYYRARMYYPDIGRFLQRDPLGYWDSMNLYAYVSNNPILYIDPFGLAQKGDRGIPGDDPLMHPNKIKELKEALKNPKVSNARKAELRGWLKVWKRGGLGGILVAVGIGMAAGEGLADTFDPFAPDDLTMPEADIPFPEDIECVYDPSKCKNKDFCEQNPAWCDFCRANPEQCTGDQGGSETCEAPASN